MLIAIYAGCHLCWVSLMLSVTYAECHYAECHYILAPFESAPFYIENTNLLCKTSYRNDEFNCTEPSPSVSIPVNATNFFGLKVWMSSADFGPNHRFKRIYLNTTWGLPALEIPWKLLDPTRTTHIFEGIFLSCVDIYAFVNIKHKNERNILSNLWYKQKITT